MAGDISDTLANAAGSSTAKGPEDFGNDFAGIARRWNAEIKAARDDRKHFEDEGGKILTRYRSDRRKETAAGEHRFNILWSNIEVLTPAVYSKRPKAFVGRRQVDADPVGLCAAAILERALNYEIEHYNDLHEATRAAVRDRLLPGIGTAWVRFEATTKEVQITEDLKSPILTGAKSCVDYVNWRDYLESPARTWEEVRWLARRVPMTRSKLTKRFAASAKETGAVLADVKMRKPRSDNEEQEPPSFFDVADVWEIWDKEDRRVIFMAQDYQLPLEVRSDPLGLEQFFPCPRPLLGTTAGDNRVPTADYEYYKDHAGQLDDVTRRISALQQAVRVSFLYDQSNEALKQLLDGGTMNLAVPTPNWQGLMEKGGVANSISVFPIEQVLQNLQTMYTAQQNLKQTIYEITGISDIVRGATVASETLGAQQLKAKFSNLRIQNRQGDVNFFVSEILGIKAQMMAKWYPPDLLLRRAAASQMSADMQALIPQAQALLRDEEEFAYRIDVASDSMIELDYDDEKQRRTEFLNAMGQFLPQAIEFVNQAPQGGPLAMEMLKFGVRGFRVGRELELEIEKFATSMMGAAQNPPPKDPDPALLRVQADAKNKQDELAQQMQLKQRELDQKDKELALQKEEIDLKYAIQDVNPAEVAKAQQEYEQASEMHLVTMQQMQVDLAQKQQDLAQSAEQHQMATAKHGADMQMSGIQADNAQNDQSLAQVGALHKLVAGLPPQVNVDLSPIAEALKRLQPALEAAGADKELITDPKTGTMRSRKVLQ